MSGIKDIALLEGIPGFYRGLLSANLQIIPYMGIVFTLQSTIKDALVEYPVNSLIAGGIAGSIGKMSVMPFDVIRKRLQVQGPNRTRYILTNVPNYQEQSFIRVFKSILKNEGEIPVLHHLHIYLLLRIISIQSNTYIHCYVLGPRGLFKGLTPSLLKTGPASAITFFVVDRCHHYAR